MNSQSIVSLPAIGLTDIEGIPTQKAGVLRTSSHTVEVVRAKTIDEVATIRTCFIQL